MTDESRPLQEAFTQLMYIANSMDPVVPDATRLYRLQNTFRLTQPSYHLLLHDPAPTKYIYLRDAEGFEGILEYEDDELHPGLWVILLTGSVKSSTTGKYRKLDTLSYPSELSFYCYD